MILFLARLLLRVLLVSAIASAAFFPLNYIVVLDDALKGFPPANWNAAQLEMLAVSFNLLAPFSILFAIGECQLRIWRDFRRFEIFAMTVHPLLLAGMGSVFAYLLFADPDLGKVTQRVLILGGALSFYLSGSFHWWLWCFWERHSEPQASLAWYAGAMSLAGAFLGSMIAWTAPSPLVSATLEYRERAWIEQPAPTPLPIEPDKNPQPF